jgi:hypothetical protein
VTEIDVAQLPIRKLLQDAAVDVVDHQPALLVGADDRALRAVGGMPPDRRIVGGVPGRLHWIGFDRGLHGKRDSAARRLRPRQRRGPELPGDENTGDHERGDLHLARPEHCPGPERFD